LQLWNIQGVSTLAEAGRSHYHAIVALQNQGSDSKGIMEYISHTQEYLSAAQVLGQRLTEVLHLIRKRDVEMPGLLVLATCLQQAATGLINLLQDEVFVLSHDRVPSVARQDILLQYFDLYADRSLYWQWDLLEEPVPSL
jgi:hypothetical protein